MVLVGFVIEKNDNVLKYINKFNEVFDKVKYSPFTKKTLFNNFYSQTKIFNDRIAFMYSGSINALSTIMFVLKYALIILLMVNSFLFFSGLLPTMIKIIGLIFFIGLIIISSYYFSISKYYFWFNHKLSFRKKNYLLHKLKKRLLNNSEIVECFLWNIKPLFKSEEVKENV